MADTALTMPRLAFGTGPLKMAGDDRLADLAAAGDERAFAAIFERHHQVLYRYCRSILGNEEDASDALQNTMLRALRALPGEKRTIALKPWLFRIAHNEAISIVRRRRPQVDVEDEALGLQSSGPEVDSDVRERVDRLFEDLRELPDRQRSALIMRELSGLSYDEIAAALHTSTGAATQAVFGARKALHEFAEGRDMLCDDIRREISRRDGRILASRRIRSHLRDCEGCTAFRALIAERERQFAAIAPPMPAIAAAAMLQNLQGGGGMGGGLTGLTSAGSSHALISAAALKAAPLIAAAAVGGGAGAIVQSDVAPITTWAEPAALVRVYAETAADEALAEAPALALRSAAARAGGRPETSSADARRGAEPASPAPAGDGTERVAQTPAARAPAADDPSPQTTPPTAPSPKPKSAPRPGSRPAPPAAPTRTPTSAPAPTSAPTSTNVPAPAQSPAPAPTTTSPPPAVPGGGEPDDNTDDEPRKKPHPCRPAPAPRGHPDGPCPS